MPLISISPDWQGQDAFIIGGGHSLRGFDFAKLEGRNVLGINDAFRLGVAACPAMLFGDDTWWQQVKFDLAEYAKRGGVVYSIAPASLHLNSGWLNVLKRIDSGWGKNDHLGWNNSTGAAGINLCVSLGAKRIFLLGFDCTAGADRKTHWHQHRRMPTQISSFDRFIRGFEVVAQKMANYAPDVQVINVSPDSRLEQFQKCTLVDMDRLIKEQDERVLDVAH